MTKVKEKDKNLEIIRVKVRKIGETKIRKDRKNGKK